MCAACFVYSVVQVTAKCYASHVTRHTSHVTRHTLHVTRHTSPATDEALRLREALRMQGEEDVTKVPCFSHTSHCTVVQQPMLSYCGA